jgi:hypothetical protein
MMIIKGMNPHIISFSIYMDDFIFDQVRQKRSQVLQQYEESKKKHTELELECMNLMDKMVDRESSVSDIIDGYF